MTSGGEGTQETLLGSLVQLESWIKSEGYAGIDPYDGLRSPLVHARPFSNVRALRLVFQQVVRRVPFNFRPFLGIGKSHNPVTYGLCIQAFADILGTMPEREKEIREQIAVCLSELNRLRSPGFSSSCWGYDFPWEGKYVSLPAYAPTVVATAIITHALMRLHKRGLDARVADLCVGAADFVRTSLRRIHDGQSICFSYSPYDGQKVINATMFASRLLAEAFQLTANEEYRSDAAMSVEFVLRHQRTDGSWPYAVGDPRQWTDNFHTAYVLECLLDYVELTNDERPLEAIWKGTEFYMGSFFHSGCVPRYYHDRTYPVDTTAVAQSILLLVRLGETARAVDTALWSIRRLQQPDGSFAYRDYRFFVNRIPYMRWSQAWMFAALSRLIVQLRTEPLGERPGLLDNADVPPYLGSQK